MFDPLFIAKIVVSILSVVTLSLLAEQVSPRIAGILSGYPLGTAIALFFIGLENGQQFAADSAIYTLAGFTAALVLVFVYYQVSKLTLRYCVVFASLLAVASFLVVAALLNLVALGLLGGGILSSAAIVFFSIKFRQIENSLIITKVKLTYWVVIVRSMFAALMIIVITGIAKISGANLAGVLSAFPISLFPFLVIIHTTYGKSHAHTIIKNYPFGLGSLIIYVISVSYTYPLYGVGIGTVMSFVFATLYLLLLSYVLKKSK